MQGTLHSRVSLSAPHTAHMHSHTLTHTYIGRLSVHPDPSPGPEPRAQSSPLCPVSSFLISWVSARCQLACPQGHCPLGEG